MQPPLAPLQALNWKFSHSLHSHRSDSYGHNSLSTIGARRVSEGSGRASQGSGRAATAHACDPCACPTESPRTIFWTAAPAASEQIWFLLPFTRLFRVLVAPGTALELFLLGAELAPCFLCFEGTVSLSGFPASTSPMLRFLPTGIGPGGLETAQCMGESSKSATSAVTIVGIAFSAAARFVVRKGGLRGAGVASCGAAACACAAPCGGGEHAVGLCNRGWRGTASNALICDAACSTCGCKG